LASNFAKPPELLCPRKGRERVGYGRAVS
jgi:hypothetical protein